MQKFKTTTFIIKENIKVPRAKETNLVTFGFVFINSGNMPANVNELLLNIGDMVDMRTPFFCVDDTSYHIKFSNLTRSNCADANQSEVTVIRYDLIN